MSRGERLSEGAFGPGKKSLQHLSDRELHDELMRRRRKRAPEEDERADAKPTLGRVRQYFANLELDAGAGLQEVERAYERLRDRYHPDKHRDDPEKHRAATELSESLTHAYRAVKRYLAR